MTEDNDGQGRAGATARSEEKVTADKGGVANHCGRSGRGTAMGKQDVHGQGVNLAVRWRLGVGQVVRDGSQSGKVTWCDVRTADRLGEREVRWGRKKTENA